MNRRRNTQVFSLAFLDCICCGFGAIILVFVLSIGAQDVQRMDVLENLRRILAAQMAELVRMDEAKAKIEAQNSEAIEQLAELRLTNDSVQDLLAEMERQLQRELAGKEALLVDLDELEQEVAARQEEPEMVLEDVEPAPVGVTIGSNYIAFVIDTSGSMRDIATDRLWPIVIQKISDVLDVYPIVDGILVLNSDGRNIMTDVTDAWMEDSPALREVIKRRVRVYDGDSRSNPVPGILRVLTRFYDSSDPDMHLSIYVFGDEFTETADRVLDELDELNPADEEGNRRVVINAIGFPTIVNRGYGLSSTNVKFANLMREMTYRHGGAFIALQDL